MLKIAEKARKKNNFDNIFIERDIINDIINYVKNENTNSSSFKNHYFSGMIERTPNCLQIICDEINENSI